MALLLISGACLPAQTNLSGTINTYNQVTAVNTGTNSVTVASTTGLTVGDTVIIMQMQGATMDASASASFGNITAIGSAGNYELAVICDVTGSEVTFDQTLARTYANSATAGVQLISYPNYGDVTINSTLSCQAWNGTTGGVLAFKSTGTVTLAANIDVRGRGFPGGGPSPNGGSCGNFSAFFYAAGSVNGANKGQGIADIITNAELGKGRQVNGGGGGNNHNCGGGGGSNHGAGGQGGNRSSGCGFGSTDNPGIGGISLNTAGQYSNAQNRVFMGGGGGGGQQNNAGGATGGTGGGIVLIQATSLSGAGFSILAGGNNSVQPFGDAEDGGGGGGGGGAVLLSVGTITSALTVNTSGGNGSNTSSVGTGGACGCATRNLGPGGGGGGGVLWVSNAGIDPLITYTSSGGTSGTSELCACVHGSVNGSAGGSLTSLNVPMSTTNYTGCELAALPVEYASFHGQQVENHVELSWTTVREENSERFDVQRSADGITFATIGTVPAAINSNTLTPYTYIDAHPIEGRQYYRLFQFDQDGAANPSPAVEVIFDRSRRIASGLRPVPVPPGGALRLDLISPDAGSATFSICDAVGKVVHVEQQEIAQAQGQAAVRVPDLAPGIYHLNVRWGRYSETFKFFVAE